MFFVYLSTLSKVFLQRLFTIIPICRVLIVGSYTVSRAYQSCEINTQPSMNKPWKHWTSVSSLSGLISDAYLLRPNSDANPGRMLVVEHLSHQRFVELHQLAIWYLSVTDLHGHEPLAYGNRFPLLDVFVISLNTMKALNTTSNDSRCPKGLTRNVFHSNIDNIYH